MCIRDRDTTDIAGTLTVVGQAQLDNININGNTIASTNTNGEITLDPNGTGDVNVEGPLDVNDSATFSSTVVIEGQTTVNDSLHINAADEQFRIRNGSDTDNQFLVDTDNGNTTINGTLTTKGNTTLEGTLTVQGNTTLEGNTTLGNDASADTVTFTAKIANNTDILAAGAACDIGSSGTPFDNGYFTNITAGTITGPVTGASSKIKTYDRSQSNPSGHYLTFVSDSGDQSEMDVYTNADFYVLPDDTASQSDLCVRGDITAFAGAASDDRLKTNKVILEGALDKVLSLSGFTFNWNGLAVDLGFVAEKQQVGVSAQQVQAVLPEAVKTKTLDDEEILIVKYEKIVPLLIEAIKELNTKVDNLEQKISDK